MVGAWLGTAVGVTPGCCAAWVEEAVGSCRDMIHPPAEADHGDDRQRQDPVQPPGHAAPAVAGVSDHVGPPGFCGYVVIRTVAWLLIAGTGSQREVESFQTGAEWPRRKTASKTQS